MKKLIITTALALVASSALAGSTIDFSFEQYKKDLDILIPLASSLKGACLMGEATKCAQSDSLIRLIHQHAMLNPSRQVLSEEETKQFEQEFLTKAAEALEKANDQMNIN